MYQTKLARVSALALILFLALSTAAAFAAPPCGCKFCQKHPEKNCRIDGTTTTCLEFLIVALCPPVSAAAEAPSSEETFLATLAAPEQDPAGSPNAAK